MRTCLVVFALIAALVAVGALLAPGPATAQGGGTIVGEVKVGGTPPAPKKININKDVEACGKEKAIAEVAVGAGNGLQDAVVSVTTAKGFKAAGKPVIDQKGCEFRPHVLLMPPGEVEILNNDGVLHNIHTFSTANSPINKAQPKFKKKMTESFGKPEVIKVQCDAHAWMLGWIVVTENPAAATDDKGAFRITDVPAGKHKLEVWHPVLGKQARDVEVKAGQETKVTFELAAK